MIFPSLQAHEHGRRHADEHTAGDGKALEPCHILLLGQIHKQRHRRRRHGHDHQRRPVADAGEQPLAGHERTDVAADVRADEADEHGRHGAVAEADSGGGFRPVVAEALEVALVEEDGQEHAPDDAEAHQQGDRREGLRRHFGGGQRVHADLLGGSLRDLRLIMQRADDGQAQPRPRRAEAAGQGDDAEQDADTRQDRECGARRDGALHACGVHADGQTRAVRAHKEHDAHRRDERDDAAADRVHRCTVELG